MNRSLIATLASAALACAAAARAEGAPAPEADRSVARAIEKVYPALVQIHVLTIDHGGGRERKFESAGSGIIISTDGYVVTNHHVVGKAAAIKVRLSSKEELDAVLVGTDAFADIAVVKLDLSRRRAALGPLPAAQFGASSALRIGDPVLAMGCPLALSHSVTQGIVANKDMMLPRLLGGRFLLDGENVGGLVKWIGHDAAIAPGNSGGPLVNLDGEVVGINEIGLGPLSGAIPSELARAVSAELIAHGKVQRAFIGADFQPLLRRTVEGDPDARGVLVSGVLQGSAVEAAGLRAGDVVTAVDGAKVSARFNEEIPAFNLLLLGKPIGADVALTVLRGGEQRTVTVKAEPRSEAAGKKTELQEWGLVVENVTQLMAKELQRPDTRGVLVSVARPGGPADRAQPALAAGDVIVSVAGKPVADVEALKALTKSLTEGKRSAVPTAAAFERQTEELVTVVEVGNKPPPEPPDEPHRAWLPVTTQVLTRKLAAALGLKGKKGVRVTQVFPGSSAEAAGLRVGDVLTHVDGNAIEASEPHDADVFDQMIQPYKLGSKVQLAAFREGKPLQLTAELDRGPKREGEMRLYEDAQLEFRARDLSVFDRVRRRFAEREAGAIVTQVETGGWAAVGGLQTDDLIQAVDERPVAAVTELERALVAARTQRAARVVMLVRRGAHTLFLELEPKWK